MNTSQRVVTANLVYVLAIFQHAQVIWKIASHHRGKNDDVRRALRSNTRLLIFDEVAIDWRYNLWIGCASLEGWAAADFHFSKFEQQALLYVCTSVSTKLVSNGYDSQNVPIDSKWFLKECRANGGRRKGAITNDISPLINIYRQRRVLAMAESFG